MLISLDGWKDDCSEKEYDGEQVEKTMTATAEEQQLHHHAAEEDLWTQCSGAFILYGLALLLGHYFLRCSKLRHDDWRLVDFSILLGQFFVSQ